MEKNKRKSRGITLVTLVVTIIVLLLLAGIAIATLGGENGLFSKVKQSREKYSIAEAKEKLELEISNLQIDLEGKGEDLKKEDLPKINKEDIDVRDTTNFPVEVIYKNYKFEIDSSFKVNYIGEANETIITYTTEPEGYTNQNKIKVLVKISNPKGIKLIFKPGETDGIIPQNKTTAGVDFSVTQNGHYILNVEDVDGNKISKDIYIDQIDKLPPKDFSVNTGDVKTTSINITIDVEDSEKTAENTKSGMERYEYYIKGPSDDKYTRYESAEKEYTYKNLSKNTAYNIYVIAYDKAGNKKQSKETVISTKANNSIGQLLLTTAGFINSYEEDSQTGEMIGTLDKSISYRPPEFQGRWGWRTVSWGIDTYYNNLYNAFDGDISTSAGFARTGNDGADGTLNMGGYVFVEDSCIGKYLNVYNSSGNIKFIFRDVNFDEISSYLINTSSNKNKIASMLIPENTEYIEMYYTGPMINGIRGMISEIFLTNMEIQENQNISEFFNN